MQKVLVEIGELNKTFATKKVTNQVLNGVSFAVNAGDFLAITGQSGCGKSTLLSIIGLLDQQTGGQYQLCGEDVAGLSTYQKSVLRNQEIGWVFQNFNLVGDMTAIENVTLPLRYHAKMNKLQRQQAALGALQSVGMETYADSLPNELSGGQQQRIAIARALVTNPSLILADEPTGNLDSENAEMVFELLQNLHKKGVTIIMVTHAKSLAARCQQQLHLHDGAVVNV
jgi:putative ABC transport system ATP-binding protein